MSVIAESTLVAPSTHLFLSPHYDDVALSCGGTAALLARHGRRPRAVVVFGGEPASAAGMTDFARFQHERWGFVDETAVASRRAEDQASAAMLGLSVDVLPFLDAIYRGERYLDDDQIFGEPSSDECGIRSELVAALDLDDAARGATRVYAPLAAGGHVDHRHAFLAGVDLAHAGWTVWFYEDLPYALDAEIVEARRASAGVDLRLVGIVDVSSTWRQKVQAVMTYASQVPVIFRHVAPGGDETAVEAALAAGARSRGRYVLAERFWTL
ncbi:MAG: PIG-L deacetylase family protein [Thermomicrobiales bacterium]